MQFSNTERYLFLTCVTVGADAAGSPARELWGLFSLENYQYPISVCGGWGEGGTEIEWDGYIRVAERPVVGWRTQTVWVCRLVGSAGIGMGSGGRAGGEDAKWRASGASGQSVFCCRWIGFVAGVVRYMLESLPWLLLLAAFSVHIFDPAVVVDVFVGCDKSYCSVLLRSSFHMVCNHFSSTYQK